MYPSRILLLTNSEEAVCITEVSKHELSGLQYRVLLELPTTCFPLYIPYVKVAV